MWVKLWSKDHGISVSWAYTSKIWLTNINYDFLLMPAPGRWELPSSCFDLQHEDISHAWWVIIMVIQNSRLWLLLTKPKLLKWTKRRITAFCMSTTLMPSTFSPDDIRPTVIWAAQAVWPSYCNILWQNCKILIADSAECNKNICLTRDWSSCPPLACIWDWVSGQRRGPPSKILTVVLAILFSLDTWLTMLPA